MSAVAIPFEDLQEYDGESGYAYPNEDVSIWRKFVKGKRIDRAAAICSGGEVGLFALLPTVRKELVLVDHSYCSLKYALQKCLLYREHGFEKTRKFLVERPAEFAKELHKVNTNLPPKLLTVRDKYDYSSKGTYIPGHRDQLTGRWVTGKFVPDELPPGERDRLFTCSGHNTDPKGCYSKVNRLDAYRALRKLHKVKFVHGDFQKLVDRGPFDLFYVSNAHQSGNGNLKATNLDLITKSVRNNGWVCVAGDVDNSGPSTLKRAGGPGFPDNWELQDESSSNQGLAWKYRLYKIRKDT